MNTSGPPLVSIVIPAYNHARYLPEAIESVLNQDYPSVELIVLDDGSTDATADVLRSYGDRFHWESHDNMGQANTLNKGWRMAKGEFLAYLSADDFLYSREVSVCVACLQGNEDAVLCYPDFDLVDPESRVVRNIVAPEYSYKEMVTRFICPPSTGALFRRSAYLKAGEWDPMLRHSPDYEYWLRLGLHGRFAHIRENLAAFRVHEGSQSFAPTTVDRAEEAVRIIEKYYRLPGLPAEIVAARAESFASANILVGQLHLRAGRHRDAASRIMRAAAISLRTLLSVRVLRMLANGLLNRHIHKVLWTIKNGLGGRGK